MNNLVDLAKQTAIKAHGEQKRIYGPDKGKPYTVHLERVAAALNGNETLEAIAWLHDVVEDTDTTLEDLKNLGFPMNVLYGVDGMTRKEGENYLAYILRVKNNSFALLVKLADIDDNMSTLPPEKKTHKDKYELARYILLMI